MGIRIYKRLLCPTFTLCLLLTTAPTAFGYGILAHQAVVDAAWEKSLKPLLLQRFPNATEEELQQAHAFAYGGSIVQDMGYFPFGNVFFTNLTHYVRSGDFVLNMVNASETLNEYAFALGTMAHYNADIYGPHWYQPSCTISLSQSTRGAWRHGNLRGKPARSHKNRVRV